MEEITIRYATRHDLDLIAPLFDAYRMFYGKPSEPEAAKAFIKERLALQDSVILLALSNSTGDALGFVQLYPTWSSVPMKRIFIGHDLYVSEKARKTGTGGKLMLAAEEHVRFAGGLRIDGGVLKTNESMQRLLESVGHVRDEKYYSYHLMVR
jgi:GNAT superfamily N-acetyltransferase